MTEARVWGLPSFCRLSYHCSMHAALEISLPNVHPMYCGAACLRALSGHTECTFESDQSALKAEFYAQWYALQNFAKGRDMPGVAKF